MAKSDEPMRVDNTPVAKPAEDKSPTGFKTTPKSMKKTVKGDELFVEGDPEKVVGALGVDLIKYKRVHLPNGMVVENN